MFFLVFVQKMLVLAKSLCRQVLLRKFRITYKHIFEQFGVCSS